MKYIFGLADYSSMIVMMVLTMLIGVYYGFIKKQKSQTDYLLGGKQMNIWPISFSLVSSLVSSVPLLTFPTEIYSYGIHYALITPSLVLASLVTYFVYLPVFYKLQLTSTYEYLNLRFNNKVRIFASLMYTLFMIIYIPLVIYVPGLTISQVTGLNLRYITPVVCGVCIFYTTVGGLKAVVWTDAVQFIGMFSSTLILLIMGASATGDITSIWNINREGGRLNLDFSMDITKRDTVWTGTVSAFLLWTSLISINQTVVQKYMALSSYKEIKHAMCIFTIGLVILLFCCFTTGLVIYARYHDCDPLTSGQIANKDQIVLIFVQDIGGTVPGLQGIYISGILSAGLSTLSAYLNSLSATIYQDFIFPFMPKNMDQQRVSLILKVIVAIFGIVCTLLVYAVEHMNSILPLALSSIGLSYGPLLGLFTVGILFPTVNSKGALTGAISALLVIAWIALKSQWYQMTKALSYPELPIRVDGCNGTTNIFLKHAGQHAQIRSDEEEISFLYKISHFHYTFISMTIVIVISVVVSCFTKNDKKVNKDYISPLVHFLVKNEEFVDKIIVDQKISLLAKK